MIRFVYGQDEEIAAFVAERTDAPRALVSNGKAIGIVDERNRFLAGFIYHHWNPEAGTIVMSGAAMHPHWLNRSVLQRLLDFPFIECGCQMLIIQLRDSDERMKRQLAVIGFAFSRIARLYGRKDDGIVATFTDDDWAACRFNRGRIALEEAA